MALSQVTKNQFYNYVGPRDIVVTARTSTDKTIGIYVDFNRRGGQLVGRVYDKPQTQYLLCESVQ